jgi:hypothetical protein
LFFCWMLSGNTHPQSADPGAAGGSWVVGAK